MGEEAAERRCCVRRASANQSSVTRGLICHGRAAHTRPWQECGSGGGQGASWQEEVPAPRVVGSKGGAIGNPAASGECILPIPSATWPAKASALLGFCVAQLRRREPGPHGATCRVCEVGGILQNGNHGSEYCVAARSTKGEG
jgi:hypothetical protein